MSSVSRALIKVSGITLEEIALIEFYKSERVENTSDGLQMKSNVNSSAA